MSAIYVYQDNHGENYNGFAKYAVGVCEIHNILLHGFTSTSDREVLGHYIVIASFDFIYTNINDNPDADTDSVSSFYSYSTDNDNYDDDDLKATLKLYRNKYKQWIENAQFIEHSFIRNYKDIISKQCYIKPEIIHKLYLSGGECVAIIKTHWLKLVQRCWKKVFNQRLNILNIRKGIHALQFRERCGTWSNNCLVMPGLKGMLHGI